MIIDYCKKHNPTYIQNGLSKYIVEYIENDLPIKTEDLIYIDFYKSDKLFYNVVFDKKSFFKYELKKRYDFEIDFNNEELENIFFKKHIKSYCNLCVKEHEKKYKYDLLDKLIKPSFFDFED